MSNQILLIDDDKDLIDSLQDSLKLRGFSVLTATNAQAGIDLYSKHNPCIVFMDIKMPNMDGYEAFSIIKKSHNDAKIVFVTGHEVIEQSQNAQNYGLIGVLQKPVPAEKIIQMIKENNC